MAKKYRITLTKSEQERLEGLVRDRSSKSPVVKRAYILLAADENAVGWTDEMIKAIYHVSIRTIERVRERFVEEGFDMAVFGNPYTGEKRIKFDGRVEAQLLALRCSEPPAGYNKWTLELLAGRLVSLQYVEGISREKIRTMLKKMNLSLGR